MSLAFQERLEIGKRFEDFVVRELWQAGLPTYVYQSRHEQWHSGESVNGIEIKFDGNFRSTGNLYIETRERRCDDGTSAWRAAGIYEDPAPRLLAIGDYGTVYVLGVRWLRVVCPCCQEHQGATSWGRLLPVQIAEQNAVDVLEVTP